MLTRRPDVLEGARPDVLVVNHAGVSTFAPRRGRLTEVDAGPGGGRNFILLPRVVYNNATNLPPNRLIKGDVREAESTAGTEELHYATGFNVVVDWQIADVAVELEPPGTGEVSLGPDGGDRVFFLTSWLGRTLLGGRSRTLRRRSTRATLHRSWSGSTRPFPPWRCRRRT